MLLGFILGLAAGVILMCILAVGASAENDAYSKKLTENIQKDNESFTYDCLNDLNDDKDIPKIY